MGLKLETVMEIRIKVVRAGTTDNIEIYRESKEGEESKYIGLDDLTDYEKEILRDIIEE